MPYGPTLLVSKYISNLSHSIDEGGDCGLDEKQEMDLVDYLHCNLYKVGFSKLDYYIAEAFKQKTWRTSPINWGMF